MQKYEKIQKKQQSISNQYESIIFFDKQTKKIQQIIKQKFINNKVSDIDLASNKLNSIHLICFLKEPNYINVSIIKTLSLYNNQINDQGIKHLTCQLYKWNQLKQLSLSYNNITMKGISYLSRAAQNKRFSQLQILSLSGNKIANQTNQLEQEGLLLKFANQNTKLKCLILQKNNINDKDMKILFKTNQKNKIVFHNLKQLFLDINMIKNEGIKALTDQMIQYPSLEKVYLHRNQINKNGIKHLVYYKNKNTLSNLKQLYLSDNAFIGSEGICQLIKGFHLGAFPLLQTLFIGKISLNDHGIEHMIKLCYPSKFLKLLSFTDISWNIQLVDSCEASKKLQQRLNSNVAFLNHRII